MWMQADGGRCLMMEKVDNVDADGDRYLMMENIDCVDAIRMAN